MEWIKISKNGRAQGKKKAFSMAHIFCYISLSLSLSLSYFFSLFSTFFLFSNLSPFIFTCLSVSLFFIPIF